jgi:3-oxoacyl-[acyl-carrier-protein] synthase-3
MLFHFSDKAITGVLSVIPKEDHLFEDELSNYNFPEKQSLKLKKVMGYNKHAYVSGNTTASDLAIYGLEHLISEKLLNADEIDALIFVTQTPDYFIPPTSSIVHQALSLRQDVYCLDINQGCAGYVIGLIEAFSLLNQPHINKVVLINSDVLSRKVSRQDRNSFPLIGDACGITIAEKKKTGDTFGISRSDGSRNAGLKIPAGGMKIPYSSQTGEMKADESGNIRSLEHLVMDGTAVFNFVLTDVSPLINDLLKFANFDKEEIDYFLFHQPNKFLLQKLADELAVPYDKMPGNIVENFGNSSGASIPVNITFNLPDKNQSPLKVCFAGFGVGLTWSAMIADIKNLDFCTIIRY